MSCCCRGRSRATGDSQWPPLTGPATLNIIEPDLNLYRMGLRLSSDHSDDADEHVQQTLRHPILGEDELHDTIAFILWKYPSRSGPGWSGNHTSDGARGDCHALGCPYPLGLPSLSAREGQACLTLPRTRPRCDSTPVASKCRKAHILFVTKADEWRIGMNLRDLFFNRLLAAIRDLSPDPFHLRHS